MTRLLIWLLLTVALAADPHSTFSVGGAYVGMTVAQAEKVLGKPQEISKPVTDLIDWKFSGPGPVDFAAFASGKLRTVWGFRLERGGKLLLRQGDPKKVVIARLGRPDRVNKDRTWFYFRDVTIRIYWGGESLISIMLEDKSLRPPH